MKKSILSLLLAVLLIFSMCPTMYAEGIENTVLTPAGDFYTSGGAANPQNLEFVRLMKATSYYNGSEATPHFGKLNIGCFSYDISGVYAQLEANKGYVVKSVKFKPYAKYYKASASDMDLDFVLIKNQWDEATVTSANINAGLLFPAQSGYGPTFSGQWGTPDYTVKSTFAARNSAGTLASYAQDVYDITPLFRKHVNGTSEENKNFFSFAMEMVVAAGSGSPEYDMASNEDVTYGGAALEFEYEYLAEMTPAKDAIIPVAASDDFELTFNNPIKSASVKVNGVEAEASIDDTKLVVDYAFNQLTDYTIEIEVSDAYDSVYSNTYSFRIGRDLTTTTIEMNKNGGNFHDAAYFEEGKATEHSLNAAKNVWYKYNETSADSFVMYRMALPTVPEGSYLEKAIFNYTVNGMGAPADRWRIFKFPGEAWQIDMDNWKSGNVTQYDENVAAIIDNYEEYKAGDCIGSSGYPGNSEQWIYSADITEYANECIEAGQSYLYIGVTAEKVTTKVRVHYASSVQNIDYTIANQPVVEFANIASKVNGSTLSELSFDVYTAFDKSTLLEAISIVDENNKPVEGASFNYSAGKVSIADAVKLEEEKTYRVVIAENTEDKFGNKVTVEKSVVYEFETGIDYVVSDFALSDANGDSLSALGEAKASATVTNNTASDAVVYIAVASYKSDDNFETVTLDSVKLCPFTVTAGVPQDIETEVIDASEAALVKAFLWSEDGIRPLDAAQIFPIQ